MHFRNIAVLLLLTMGLTSSGCIATQNDCDRLAKLLCEDKRVQTLKRLNERANSESLILTDNVIGYSFPTITAITSECGRAKEMARLPGEASTPLQRDEALSVCQTCNAELEMLLMMVPDR